MASLKALLKRLIGLRGGRYSLGNYITLTVNTEVQTAAQDGLLMMRHNSSQESTADCILMVNNAASMGTIHSVGRKVSEVLGIAQSTTQVWVLADNTVATPTVAQLAQALKLAGE